MQTKSISQKAAEYSTSNAVDCLSQAIEKAYTDGFLDGYQEGLQDQERGLIHNIENEVAFVDLGLPSKTLWSADYNNNEDGNRLYYPFGEASQLSLPKEEQWIELQKYCSWHTQTRPNNDKVIVCVGPSGESLEFHRTGELIGNEFCNGTNVYFWLASEEGVDSESSLEKRMAVCFYGYKADDLGTLPVFIGFKLPVRLVRNREL